MCSWVRTLTPGDRSYVRANHSENRKQYLRDKQTRVLIKSVIDMV